LAEKRLDRTLLLDPHTSAALLKRFFAALRPSLVSLELERQLVSAKGVFLAARASWLTPSAGSGAEAVATVLRHALSDAAFATLAFLMQNLARLARASAATKMGAANLGMCWSNALFECVALWCAL
jgi:hypothetical protein